jgi:SAM-dependent methyltransferase
MTHDDKRLEGTTTPPSPSVVTPATYARWRQSTLGSITEELEYEAVATMLPEIRGKNVLDAGCGDGTYAIGQASQGSVVTALDLSFPMLTAARQRAKSSQASVRWCQGDIEALPFADGSFDVALAITVLCMVDSPERAVQELARVLRPEGVLIIGDLGRWNCWAASRRMRAWLGSRAWQHARFWSFAALRRLAGQAGLNTVTTRAAIFYPPCGLAARLCKPWDSTLSRRGELGTAFLVLKARKNG